MFPDTEEPLVHLDAAAEPAKPPRAVRLTATVLIVSVALVATAIFLGSRLKSPEQAAAESAPPAPSVVTAKAERRVLTEPLIVRGTVVPGPSVKLVPPLGASGADAVVTAVRLGRGDKVRSGTVVAEQAGQPIIAMALPFGLYRDIGPDMSGPDVEAVQRALRALGYRAGASGRFDSTTRTAFRRFLQDRGYRELLDAPAAAADPAPSASAQAANDPAQEINLRRSWFLRIKKASQTVTAVKAKVGDVLTEKSVLVELDSGSPTVKVVVDAGRTALLDVGRAAEGMDETAEQTVGLKVSAIGTKPQVDPNTGSSGIPVTLAFTGERMSVSDRSIRVSVAAATSGEPVLAVPVTGVFARPDGAQIVTVVQDSGELVDVTVQTGDTGGGWVEITSDPPDLVADGTRVVVGQS